MDLTDKEYVERCRDGHPEDFGLLVDRYQKPLFSYLACAGGSLPQAEEAAQESFVRAFLSLPKLRKPESFYSWLLGIAGRVAKEQFRSEARRRKIDEAAETMMTDAAGQQRRLSVGRSHCAPARKPSSGDSAAVLRGAFLPGSGHAPRLPLGTVTKTLSRAYLLLRQELQARESRTEQTVNLSEQP